MIESSSLEEDNIIKYVRNIFRLEKLKNETTDTTMKDRRNYCRVEKEKKVLKDRILSDVRKDFRLERAITDMIVRNIRNLFENVEEKIIINQ